MKANRLMWFLVFLLVSAVFQLPAQQSEADRKLLADIRARAEKGEAQSQAELGSTFSFGDLGVAKDEVEAVKWYRKAAAQNHAGAQYNLGVCYEQGQGVTKDEAEAVEWYRKAAEQNHAWAQNNMGLCYANGQGVPKDEVEAVKWYRKAAEQNNAVAQYNLGNCYYSGSGVGKDDAWAAKWYRKAAEQDDALAQYNLGVCYEQGQGTTKDEAEAVKWYRKASEQNNAAAKCGLGNCYLKGIGVGKDEAQAVKWYRKAAGQNNALAQANLGNCYFYGRGVVKDEAEAARWHRKAAEQNDASTQFILSVSYARGEGVAKDYVEAYKWCLLAAAQGNDGAKNFIPELEDMMTREQIAEGQKVARSFKPREVPVSEADRSAARVLQLRPEVSGTGFFITEDGYFITSEHVAGNGAQVRLVTGGGLISAKVVKVDSANDLALLKAEGRFAPLPIVGSRAVRLGGAVATVGFPNIGLQGFAPKLAKGEIAALSGAQDDPRYFQISVPVQPGNSGGALVDERGNVVGVVAAKLNAAAAVTTGGSLPENVNYAVKSSFLLGFLESVPEVSAKLKEPKSLQTPTPKFEDMVKSAEQAAVLVLVY